VVEVAFAGPGLDVAALGGIEGVEKVEPVPNGFRLHTPCPGRAAQEIACLARERGVDVETINTREPSLEEVFLHITEGPVGSVGLSGRRGPGGG
jgi:hypothetical protein